MAIFRIRSTSVPIHLCILLALVGAGNARAQAAKTLCSDETAYTHLFQMLSPAPSEAPEAFRARRNSYLLHRIGLDPQQGEALKSAADAWHAYMSDLQAQATREFGPAINYENRTLPSAAKQRLQELGRSRTAVVRALILKLHQDLDDQGNRILSDFINFTIKPNVEVR